MRNGLSGSYSCQFGLWQLYKSILKCQNFRDPFRILSVHIIIPMFYQAFFIIFISFSLIPENDAHCVDIHHHIVSQGLHYVPGPNPCTLCICEKGTPKWCKQVLCSPPQNCKSFEVGNSCCEFKCLDDILSKSDNYNETYDLALRLIASAVTAVLSLSLLLFLIHRLRQRKIRLRRQNRQLSEDQRSLNSIGYITGSLGYLPGSIGYLGSASNEIEFHYEECNVQYPLWKPPGNYFPRGEAPPPYEEAVRAARSEVEMANNQQHNLVSGQVNAPPFTFSSNRNENVSLTLVHNTHVSITPSVPQTGGMASSQCNVMLHQSNNVQSLHADSNNATNNSNARSETPTNNQQNTSLSMACDSSHDYVVDSSSNFLPNAVLESQVDVHYENYNRNTVAATPVVTVSVKNEESFPKEALNIDYFRDRVDRGTCATMEPQHEPKSEPVSVLSCSSSWRREAVQNCTTNCTNNNKSASNEYKQKIIDKNKVSRIADSTSSVPSSSKNYRPDNQIAEAKFKKNSMTKEISRSNKVISSRICDKQKSENKVQKSHNNDVNKDITVQEASKHRTISQKISKTLDSDLCYVNTTDIKRKDDDFSEHCDMILKQHNIDKIRYAAEKLEKKNSDKSLNASIRNSLCAPAELRNTQRSATSGAIGLMRGDISTHRTLPKNLRELSEAFYFNFDNTVCEDLNLDCLMKKTFSRTVGVQNEASHSSVCLEKVKNGDITLNTNTVGRKHTVQKLNSINPISNNSNLCYRNSILSSGHNNTNQNFNPSDPPKNFVDKNDVIEAPELNGDRDRNCVSYRCVSPAQDDVDDYRSECENCKSLSFEDCNEEEGDLLNETMTLQRRPMEQGEEHSFYRTSLTLPSHTKKAARSVPLNTQRESWFMAMQEMTSSSESD